MNVAMPTSIAGTNQCTRKPTPSPIAIHTPILTNNMSRNRNRDRTLLPFLLEPPSHSAPRMTTVIADPMCLYRIDPYAACRS